MKPVSLPFKCPYFMRLKGPKIVECCFYVGPISQALSFWNPYSQNVILYYCVARIVPGLRRALHGLILGRGPSSRGSPRSISYRKKFNYTGKVLHTSKSLVEVSFVLVGRFFWVVCIKRVTSFYPCWHFSVKHLIMYSPNERYLEPVAKTPHLWKRWIFWAPCRTTGAFTNRNVWTTKICPLRLTCPPFLID